MSMGLETASLFTADYSYNTFMANFDGGPESIARQADKGKLAYSNPASRQGLNLFKQLYDEGVFNDSVLHDSYDPAAKNLFKDKKVAMFWQSGPWMAHYVVGRGRQEHRRDVLPERRRHDRDGDRHRPVDGGVRRHATSRSRPSTPSWSARSSRRTSRPRRRSCTTTRASSRPTRRSWTARPPASGARCSA